MSLMIQSTNPTKASATATIIPNMSPKRFTLNPATTNNNANSQAMAASARNAIMPMILGRDVFFFAVCCPFGIMPQSIVLQPSHCGPT